MGPCADGYATWVDTVLCCVDRFCFALVNLLLRAAVGVEATRARLRRRASRLRVHLRRLLRSWRERSHPPSNRPRASHRPAWNRTPRNVEERIIRMHLDMPMLGAGQLNHLVFRLLGFRATRETIRRILQRNQTLIVSLQKHRRDRRIFVNRKNRLWGLDLTHFWILGVFPIWVLGAVDYHGSRIVLLEPLAWPTADQLDGALRRAFDTHGVPRRVLTDRGPLFRADVFRRTLASRGVVHTRTLPGHPWTNGRIERVFRTLKETLAKHYWLCHSPAHLAQCCAEFRSFYNAHRPHSAYGGRTPNEVTAGIPARLGHLGRISFFEGRLRWWRFS
jgi:putative transposase